MSDGAALDNCDLRTPSIRWWSTGRTDRLDELGHDTGSRFSVIGIHRGDTRRQCLARLADSVLAVTKGHHHRNSMESWKLSAHQTTGGVQSLPEPRGSMLSRHWSSHAQMSMSSRPFSMLIDAGFQAFPQSFFNCTRSCFPSDLSYAQLK
jgi:hypothetical protein